MEMEMGEMPATKKEEKEKTEYDPLNSVRKNIAGLEKMRNEKTYQDLFGDTKYGYEAKECLFIELMFKRVNILLDNIGMDKSIVFGNYPNIDHIVNNLLMAETGYTNRIIRRLKENEGFADRNELGREKYHENLEKSLKDHEKEQLMNFKEASIYLIYYFDLISDKDYREALLAECKAGWLKCFEKYYKSDEKTQVKKIPFDSSVQLKHINFFARLKGRKSVIGNSIEGLRELCEPINTREEFEKAFAKLEYNDVLTKEELINDFIEKNQNLKEAA